MKKPFLLTAVFLLLLSGICCAVFYAFWDQTTISMAENRVLAECPELSARSWFTGEFSKDFEEFLSDHTYKRADLIQQAVEVEALLERKTEVKLVSFAASEMAAGATGEEETESTDEQIPGAAQDQANTTADEETQDRLVLNDRILTVFEYDKADMEYYAGAANDFYSMFPDYMKKYCLIAPSRIAFEAPDVAEYSDDQREAIEYAYTLLDPLVTTVDAYSNLEAHVDSLDDLYFRLDHHWTHLGSYYAAEAFFRETGLTYIPIEKYERKEGNSFLGYYYAQNPDPAMEEHRDDLIYYLPLDHDVPRQAIYALDSDGNLEVTENVITIDSMRGGYYTFIARSFAYSVIKGANAEGSCILVAADSYGNAFCTWLAENYRRVILIDPRDYKLGREGVLSLVQEYAVTEVMLVDYLGALSSPYFPAKIRQLSE